MGQLPEPDGGISPPFWAQTFPGASINQVTLDPGPASVSQTSAMPPQPAVNGIVPQIYGLRLQLPASDDDGSNTPVFYGSMDMNFVVVRLTRNIVLNSKQLNIPLNTITVRDGGGTNMGVSNVIGDTEAELLIVQTETTLSPDQTYTLSIPRYSGTINVGGIQGLFASYVQDTPGGDQLYAMVTQFQVNAARMVFPCVDTPRTKSVLSVTVVHPVGTTALSNMPADTSRRLDDNWMEQTFAETPPLPTYLMALAVIPDVYELVEAVSVPTAITVRLRFNPREIYDPDKLLEYSVFSLDSLHARFDEPLPMSKLDVLIVPPNFSGGMENFGLITLSQDFMKKQSEMMKLYIIAHEVAHQWVGNLFTIASWSELCLQEDLTDWYAYKVVSDWTGEMNQGFRAGKNQSPEWYKFRLYNYLELQMVESLIAPGESLLIQDPPTMEGVGSRCYLKGVVLFQSMERLLGSEVFERKIRGFLSKYRYRSYQLNDFIAEFSDQFVDGRTSVAQTFDFWYKNGGFPNLMAERDYARRQIRLTQANAGRMSQMGTASWRPMPVWPIPITIDTPLGQADSPVQVMTSAGLMVGPLPVEAQQYVLINADFNGFYRVNYDRRNWELIQRAMADNPDQFTALTRAQLITDFCYFNGRGNVPNGDSLRQAFVDMVYARPDKYDLCHWYMQSCAQKRREMNEQETNEARETVRTVLETLDGMFTLFGNEGNESDYSCQTQQNQLTNQICQLFFGGQCYPTVTL